MKRFLSVLFGSGLLLLSTAAKAQNGGPGPYYPQLNDRNYRGETYYQNGPAYGADERYRDERYTNERYNDVRNPAALVRRVMSDLNQAAQNARFAGGERKHFDEGARQLDRFEDRLVRGKFDTGTLNEAIEELDHLSKSNRLSGRDREVLDRDAWDLRQLRSARGRLSREGDGGYREDHYNQDRYYDPYRR